LADRATLAILVPMPTPKTILIIDDDDDLREALAEQLALHEAFRPVQASTAAEGVRSARIISACYKSAQTARAILLSYD